MIDYESLLSERVKVVKPSGIRKFFDYAATMQDVISLGVGEPDFETPWQIRRAGIQSLEKGKTFYTSNWGLADLRREIAGLAMRRYGLAYEPEKEVLVTVGGSEGIDNTIRALVSFGDEVLIPEPSFVCYTPLAIMAGGVPVPLPTYEKDQFKLTPETLRAAITPKTKLLILPYPNNPTGAIMTRSELEAIAGVIRNTNIAVISDEIYCSLTYEDRHVCFAELPGMRERTIVIDGFSKSYAMTGWRIGYAACNQYLAKMMGNYLSHSISNPCSISQYAAIEALTGPQNDIEEMRKAFEVRRNHLVERMNRIEGVSCLKPQGAFYVMMNMKSFIGKTMYGHVIESDEDFAQLFLEKGLVATVPCTSFAAPGYIRWSYATSMEEIDKGLDRLETFIKNA